MSETILIAYGGKAPADPAENAAFHQSLLDDLKPELARAGWAGVAFCHYARSEGYVSIEIEAGQGALDLETLRAFSEAKRKEREERQLEPEQGSLC